MSLIGPGIVKRTFNKSTWNEQNLPDKSFHKYLITFELNLEFKSIGNILFFESFFLITLFILRKKFWKCNIILLILFTITTLQKSQKPSVRTFFFQAFKIGIWMKIIIFTKQRFFELKLYTILKIYPTKKKKLRKL